MDCDKFESSMLDELYGELDELTVAASKRHLGGCARCAALMAGLRATRKIVTLPVLAPSEGFESRLLSAVHAAEAKAKPRLTLAELISWGGGWAMRPQTAMAAVLLLMVGTSSVLLSKRMRPARGPEAAFSSFTVTENGAPAPAAEAAMGRQAVDLRAAAAAHGAAAPPPMAAASAAPLVASNGANNASKPAPGLENAPVDVSPDPASGPMAYGGGKMATAPKQRMARSAPAGGGSFDDVPGSLGSLGHGGGAGLGDLKGGAETQFAPPPPASPPAVKKDDSPFAAAKSQYNQRDYAGATQAFDGLAAGGDSTAALWAARSVRDGEGCSAAIVRFDQLASSAWGSSAGYDATYDAADCYARMGDTEAALSRYRRLLTVPAYAARAQAFINANTQVASSKPRAVSKAAATPAAAAPAAPQATAPAAAAAPSEPPSRK